MRSHATSSFWSGVSTPRVTSPWSFPANTSRLSLPGDESPRAAAAGKGFRSGHCRITANVRDRCRRWGQTEKNSA